MKNLILFSLTCTLLLSSLNVSAQTTISEDFESWTTNSGVEVPDGWATGDQSPHHQQNGYTTVFKSSDSYSGNYALHLKPLNSSPDFAQASAGTGFSINYRPQNLTGYYKSSMDNTDSLFIYVYLYKDNDGNFPELVGYAFHTTLAAASSYTSFSIPITYLDNRVPDSGAIVIQAWQNLPQAQHEAYFDDLGLSGTAGMAGNTLENQAAVYPNPTGSSTIFTLKSNTNDLYTINLLDISGRYLERVYEGIVAGELKLEIDLTSYPLGMYFLQAVSNEKRQVLKIIKN